MKTIAPILFFVFLSQIGVAQYYYRGEIVDEKSKPIPNANIYIHSSKLLTSAGSSGSFGIMTTKPTVDTFTISADGYDKKTIAVFSQKYNTVPLNLLASLANMQKNRLASCTKDFKSQLQQNTYSSNESYTNLVENDFITAAKNPTTGFAVNTDRASYSNIRRFINMKTYVPTNAVRIDEMINYFNLVKDTPSKNSTFNITTQISQCPWNLKNILLYISIAARKLDLAKIPPSNLVFLIDNSGSMELQNRMPLLKSAFKLLVKNLREQDKITIITYGGMVGVELEGVSGKYQDSILKVIEEMEASGDTPGESAIRLAYAKAKQYFIAKGNNRVILATDGDFNVGIADETELERLISLQSQSGIYLTCLGVGMGNYKDSKLEALAKKGNGNFAYLDNEAEAEKILVKEMTQTLFSVADNTFMDVQFDATLVQQYRLLGFDNKANALADGTNQLEGGQVGSGYSTMVLFELVPTANFTTDSVENSLEEQIAAIKISYQNVENKKKQEELFTAKANFLPLLSLPKQYGFAAAIAMFGSYIKQSKYMGKIDLDAISALLTKTIDTNNSLQVELLQLVEKAKAIYEPGKKKKKKNKGTEAKKPL